MGLFGRGLHTGSSGHRTLTCRLTGDNVTMIIRRCSLVLLIQLLGLSLAPCYILAMSVDFCPQPAPFSDTTVPFSDDSENFPMEKYLKDLETQPTYLLAMLHPYSTLMDESIETESKVDTSSFPLCLYKRVCERNIRKLVYWKVSSTEQKQYDGCWLVEPVAWVTCNGGGPELGEFYGQCMNKDVGVTCRPVYVNQLVWIWCEEGPNMGFHVIKLPISAKCTTLKYPCLVKTQRK